MDMIVLLLVEEEVVVWVLPDVSSGVAVDIEVAVVVLVVHLEDLIKMTIR